MARRRGRPGNYLMSDDYSGNTTYADKLQLDYWGNYTRKPLIRNLQEIASPLGDPYPVPIFRGAEYENTTACDFELLPLYTGNTTRPFPKNSAYAQFVNLDPAIGTAIVGCTFRVG